MTHTKILTLLLTLGVFLGNSKAIEAATLSLSPPTATINRGCNVTLNIDLDTGGKDTDGTDAVLIYDQSKLTTSTSAISNGKIYVDYPGNAVDTTTGKISISGLSSVSSPFNGKGTLATISFTVNQTAPAGATAIKFDFDPSDKTKTTDSNVVERSTVADLLNLVVDGNYTVGTGQCNNAPLPSGVFIASGAGSFRGAPGDSTLSAVPVKSLPPAGFTGATMVITVFGVALAILGIAGLALL